MRNLWIKSQLSYPLGYGVQLSGVVIDTVLKMDRKRIENVAEIRGYKKARCMLGLSVKKIHN